MIRVNPRHRVGYTARQTRCITCAARSRTRVATKPTYEDLARLRHRQFFSLGALNAAIAELLVTLNNRPLPKNVGCRRSAFEMIDRPAMAALPIARYGFSHSSKAIVNIGYHIEFDDRYYSVPHTSVRRVVEVRATANLIGCLFKGNLVALHARATKRGAYVTLAGHVPESHRKHTQWTPGRLLNWALTIGTATRDVVRWQLANRPHPEQG